MRMSVSEAIALADGREMEIVAAISGTSVKPAVNMSCPACGGRDRFRVKSTRPFKFWCNSRGNKGDIIDFVAHHLAGDGQEKTSDAINWIAEYFGAGGIGSDQLQKRQQEARQRAEEEERKRRQEEGRVYKETLRLFSRIHAEGLPFGSNKHLERKQIIPLAGVFASRDYQATLNGKPCRVEAGDFILPVYVGRKVTGYQQITHDGKKLMRGKMTGAATMLGYSSNVGVFENTVFISESYTTGASIFLMTHNPVVLAFSANNLRKVALNVASKASPDTRIVIAADNDLGKYLSLPSGKVENPGVYLAGEAEKSCYLAGHKNVSFVVPWLNMDDPHDFNDVWVAMRKGEISKRQAMENLR